eukprot:SAG31_NODE_5893_length_2270_cov_1.878858_5_plen_111_part_00
MASQLAQLASRRLAPRLSSTGTAAALAAGSAAATGAAVEAATSLVPAFLPPWAARLLERFFELCGGQQKVRHAAARAAHIDLAHLARCHVCCAMRCFGHCNLGRRPPYSF